MPPQMSDYQSAAQAIYQPQQQAESTALKATHDTTVNSLESEKGQVSTDYQSAIDKLTQSVQDQTGQINQLYSQRLGGNFSGLQGNDMGQMFARANEQQAIIGQTRANKLAQITAGETNADINYNAGEAALAPKYQSQEAQYAQNAYAGAIKEYNTQKQNDISNNFKMANLNLGYARLAQSGQNSANAQNDKVLSQYKAVQRSGGGFGYVGPNGQAINLGQYAKAVGGGDDAQAVQLIRNQLQNDSTSTGQNALKYLNSQLKIYGNNYSKVIGAISNKKDFSALFNGM